MLTGNKKKKQQKQHASSLLEGDMEEDTVAEGDINMIIFHGTKPIKKKKNIFFY